jgi:hypothetical protein
MPLQQRPPGGGGRRPRVHFIYTATPPGPKCNWHAYVAGPCHWFDCHTKGKSKPCVHIVTNGDLHCPICSPLNCPEVIGYLPLYRQIDGRPSMVIVHEYSREQIDTLKLHERVLIGRGEGPTDAVWAIPAMSKEPRYQSRLPERNAPADLTETLLRIWNLPDLVEWYQRTNGKSDNAVSLSPPPPPPPPRLPAVVVAAKGPLDRLREAEEKAKQEDAAEQMRIGNTMGYLLGRVGEKNGKKKKQ